MEASSYKLDVSLTGMKKSFFLAVHCISSLPWWIFLVRKRSTTIGWNTLAHLTIPSLANLIAVKDIRLKWKSANCLTLVIKKCDSFAAISIGDATACYPFAYCS